VVTLFALSLALFSPLTVHTPAVQGMIAPQSADSAIDAARVAMARGLGWRASLLLGPVLADPARRTPEALILAARAASSWEGWAEVERLIGDAPWLDSAFDGEGRDLLARAALARRADSAAAVHAALAVRAAPDSVRRGERLVILARALDRLDSLARAANAYAEAATLLPELNQWLIFRAAIVTADPAPREQLFGAIASPVARAKLAAARAEALGRSADSAGAADAYAALGDWPTAYRYRLGAARGDSARAAFRAELVTAVRTKPGTAQARAAVSVLDQRFDPFDAELELSIGRALASGGSSARAVAAFRKGLAAGAGTSRDRYDYARHLFALGRYEDAAAQFARVVEPASLAASAAYQRARALVRDGNVAAGRTALRAIGPRFPRETEAAALALFLLGDLATDERRDAAAREAFRAVVTRHPRASVAPGAAFRAAIIAFIDGNARMAAAEFDALAERYPTSAEATAARYWAGRAWHAAGDTAAARARWSDATARDRAGYYGGLASRRLGVPPWVPAAARDTFLPVPDVEAALDRADRLATLGMDREAGWERDAVQAGDGSAERLLAVAHAFRSRAMASRGMRLTWRAIAAGAPTDARTYRLLYPLVHQEPLDHEARARGVDPSFAAALIRQESNFTPGATSAAGARGLMQVMPAVGQAVARGLRFPVWDPVLLYQADVNVQLGMAHLAELLERYDRPVHVLAAYNAGASRVERWKEKRGVEDPELFAERIPYAETRDYVRIIQRTAEFYRSLYTWGQEPLSLAPPVAAP
jgi:soluble lytic murein transglycosylase